MRRIDCPISIEDLRKLYTVEKLTDQKIADQIGLGATVKRVRSWRKRFGILTINRTERHNVLPIEGNLRSLLVGSMLGDGRLDKLPNTTRYMENHADSQREYAEWKRLQWGSWVKSELKPVSWVLEGQTFYGWRFETVAHASFNKWHSLFYNSVGPKLLRSEAICLVDPLALAIWYMDDGSAGWWPEITFGMPKKSHVIAFQLLEKFNLKPRWKRNKGNTGVLIFEGEDQAHLFISLVKPYILDCMKYKLNFGFQGPFYQIRQATPENILREMASKNVPIRRMAKELGVSTSSINRRLQQHSIFHPRKIGRPSICQYQIT